MEDGCILTTDTARRQHLRFAGCHQLRVPRHRRSMFGRRASSSILEEVDQEKDLGIIISSDLKCSQQCLYACNEANKVLGMIRGTTMNKKLRIMISLYKTLVRPHVEYCSSAWSPLYKKGKELIENI